MKATDAYHTPWKTSAKQRITKTTFETSVKLGKESVYVYREGANNSRLKQTTWGLRKSRTAEDQRVQVSLPEGVTAHPAVRAR